MYVCMHVCMCEDTTLTEDQRCFEKSFFKGQVRCSNHVCCVCMNVCMFCMHAVQIVLRLWKQLDAHGIEYLKDADHREAAGSIHTYIHIHR